MIGKFSFILTALITATVLARPSEDSGNQTKISTAHQTHFDLPNVMVHDSQNRQYRLSELLQHQVAVVNFIFTSCSTICPVLSATMQNIEKRLHNQLGKNVILISVSVDPVTDTPEKLYAYAKRFNAGPHWYWLTGRPSEINQLLKAFSIPSGRPEDHPPVLLVGHANTRNWFRWIGIPSPQVIVETVDVLVNDHLPEG